MMNRNFFRKSVLCFVVTLILMPSHVSACNVCFTSPDDPQTQGVQGAIIFMLITTYVLLMGILGFFFYMWRRGRVGANRMALNDLEGGKA